MAMTKTRAVMKRARRLRVVIMCEGKDKSELALFSRRALLLENLIRGLRDTFQWINGGRAPKSTIIMITIAMFQDGSGNVSLLISNAMVKTDAQFNSCLVYVHKLRIVYH